VTLSCRETEARLCDVVDGRLEPSVEMRVHAHLEACARCRERAERWRLLIPRMRGFVPSPPAELAARHMEVELLRRLQSKPAARPAAWRPWKFGAAFGAVTVAAVLLLWARPWGLSPGPSATAFATVTRSTGGVTASGRALAAASSVAAESRLQVGAGGDVELTLARGSRVRLRGPAEIVLGGSTRAVALQLAAGTLDAEVAHRMADETFVVSTRDLRVEVRGTRFSVAAEARGSSVRVAEGRVAVTLGDGSTRLVGAGESATTVPAQDEPPADEGTTALPGERPAASGPVVSCASAVRTCQAAASTARRTMRGGDEARALRLIAAAGRAARDGAPSCGRELAACEDELGYLDAEALRAAGRLDEAVAAYRTLNRAGAPPEMRQNALYAAAELERRRGRTRAACADYEGALAAAPRGALREESLVGAMECAEELGERARAGALGRKYLAEFPTGRAGADARRVVAGAPRP